jgi:hypothetical protein
MEVAGGRQIQRSSFNSFSDEAARAHRAAINERLIHAETLSADLWSIHRFGSDGGGSSLHFGSKKRHCQGPAVF